MFSETMYAKRREKLAQNIQNGLVLLPGNVTLPMNYPKNYMGFRQDSNFLYYIGIDHPNLYAIIDCNTNSCTLYGNEVTMDDTIWMGNVESLQTKAQKSAINKIQALGKLSKHLKGKQVHFIAPYQAEIKIQLSELLGIPYSDLPNHQSAKLTEAIATQRSVKDYLEIEQIERALNLATIPFHKKAMQMAKPGVTESEIMSTIQQISMANNFQMAFPPICSVNGQVLHNNSYCNTLKTGQMLLVDSGAENTMHYASDVTRTTPVGGKFSVRQKEIYDIVLKAQATCIQNIKSGVLYRDIHFLAAREIANGLNELGFLNIQGDEAVELGLHTMFFPHGIGHLLGLDVHDLENFGEDNIGYTNKIVRSKDFGTAFLRLAKKIESNFVVTVEPGIYFIPALIEQWKKEKKYSGLINFNKCAEYYNFGGVRIEDTVLVKADSCKVLGDFLPKTTAEIEEFLQVR